MITVILFSLGVERGKRITPKASGEEANVAPRHEQPQSLAGPAEEKAKEVSLVETQPQASPQKNIRQPENKVLYSVQVASYAKEDAAKDEAENIKKTGQKAFVAESGKYYVVYVGEFKDKKDAEQLKNKLQKKYPGCYVRKR